MIAKASTLNVTLSREMLFIRAYVVHSRSCSSSNEGSDDEVCRHGRSLERKGVELLLFGNEPNAICILRLVSLEARFKCALGRFK